MEGWCLKHCNTLITNTRSSAERYAEIYPDYVSKITYIYNGIEVKTKLVSQHASKFKMVYCGAFYNEEYLDLLFEAAAQRLPEGQYELVFTGNKNQRVYDAAKRWGIADHLNQTGFVSREEVDQHLSDASLLLFHNGFNRHGTLNKYVIKSKLYDYLATGTPMLALAPEGEVAEMISRYSPLSQIVSSGFDRAIGEKLGLAYTSWYNGERKPEITKSEDFKNSFSPSALSEKLANVLDLIHDCEVSQGLLSADLAHSQ